MKNNRNAAKVPTKQDEYIGQRIREARIANGLSQTELGGLLGVSYQQVQKYEQGKNRINGARIELLISGLNRPFSYFFPGATDVRAPADPELAAFLATKEGRALLPVFARIDAADRRCVLSLAKHFAGDQSDG
jgi:transcriptional regulator with XRE-family HTH domain